MFSAVSSVNMFVESLVCSWHHAQNLKGVPKWPELRTPSIQGLNTTRVLCSFVLGTHCGSPLIKLSHRSSMNTMGIWFLPSFICWKYFISFFAGLTSHWSKFTESASSRVGMSCQLSNTNAGITLEAEGLVWVCNREWKLHERADCNQGLNIGQDWHEIMINRVISLCQVSYYFYFKLCVKWTLQR